MKIYFSWFLLLVFLISGCTKKENNAPLLSFTYPVYFLTKEKPLVLTVYITGNAGKELRIPFVIGGTAERGNDYMLEQTEFVIPAGADSASVTILPKDNVVDQKEIRLELQPVEGYMPGRNKVAVIPVETQDILTCSFDKQNYTFTGPTEIIMLLYLGTRAYSRPSAEIEVPFEIDPASTAVENVHYRFSDDRRVLVMGTASARASTRIVPMEIEEGKNTIILKLSDSKRFLPGLYNQTTITLTN